MGNKITILLIFISGALFGQRMASLNGTARMANGLTATHTASQSSNTVTLGAAMGVMASQGTVTNLRYSGYVVEGRADDTLTINLNGLDSVVITKPSTITLSATKLTASGNVAISYTQPSPDTMGLDTALLTLTSYKGGQSSTKTIRVTTFDSYWSDTSLTYVPDINITDTASITTKRTAMRTYLYPSGYPTTHYDALTYNYPADAECNPYIGNLLRIDRHAYNYHIWTNYIYRMVPKTWNGEVAILALGHWDTYTDSGGSDVMADTLLNRGYEVYFAYMPQDGDGSAHNSMSAEEPNTVVMTAFLDHLVRCLNFIEDTLGVDSVYITGISGGGWTSPIIMALDTRIIKGIGLAGSHPLALTSYTPGSNPHYEQGDNIQEFYSTVASYEDLYLMAVSGGREYIGLHNPFDNCCYGKKVHFLYANTLQALAKSIGGTLFINSYYPGATHGYGATGRTLTKKKFPF